jgi:hemin uptake protein HemP
MTDDAFDHAFELDVGLDPGHDFGFRPDAPEAAPPACRRFASDHLFRGADEVHIDHRGAVYRLKVTSLGKLILTK